VNSRAKSVGPLGARDRDTVVSQGMINRVVPVKLADSVAAELERLVGEGVYLPGEKLPPERTLAERFGVGRSSMREALRTLESRKILRTTHGVGIFVLGEKRAQFDSEFLGVEGYSLADLDEVRLAIEPVVAALAAERVTESEAAWLLELLREASRPDLQDPEFIEGDARIHRAISVVAKNGLFVAIEDSLRPLFLDYSARVISLPGRRDLALKGLEQIVGAVARRHPRDARRAAERHITDGEQDVIRHVSKA